MNIKKKNRSNSVLNILLICLALAIGIGIVPAFLGAVNPAMSGTWYGFRPYVVASDSMEDTIMTGALLIGRVTPFEALEVGDIITFEQMFDGEPGLNTHRIIDVGDTQITTQGDNSDRPDSLPVTQQNFRYRVVFIWNDATQLGTVRGMLLYIALPIAVLIGLVTGVSALIKAMRRKKANAPPAPLNLPPQYPQQQWQVPPAQQPVQCAQDWQQPPMQAQCEQPVQVESMQAEPQWQVPPPAALPQHEAQARQAPAEHAAKESKFARWKKQDQQTMAGPQQECPPQAIAPSQPDYHQQAMAYPCPAPAPYLSPYPQPTSMEDQTDEELLCLIEAAINPEEDLELLIDTALCRKQPREKEDHEWFNHLMRQKGIAVR